MSASILIVDDDFQIVQVCESALKHVGYSVSTAENGRKALAALAIKEFDLIRLDISMPEVDGLEFLNELSQNRAKLKVVAMSGRLHCLKAARQMGAKAILAKPFSLELLLKVVSETLVGESSM